MNDEVLTKISSYPKNVKNKIIEVREIIYNTAAKNPEVGKIEECLKWGEPSYITAESNSGTIVRIDWKEKTPDVINIYFNCNTQMINILREVMPNSFEYSGNRSLSFPINKSIPKTKLKKCFEIALQYKLKNYKDFFK